jgi:hypothetical protein
MPVRMVLNVVYAHLIAGAQSEEDRDKFDGELYSSVDGSDERALKLLQQMGG